VKERAIVWFRNDLRLHDNEALSDAISQCQNVIPVFVFDSRYFSDKSRFGCQKTGVHRAKFIIESVKNLKENLNAVGSDLIIRIGNTEEEVHKIANELKSNYIYCNRERTRDEIYVQDTLEEKLWSIGQELRYSRGKMLYYTADLPFPVTHTPDAFSHFKKEVERFIEVRQPIPNPTYINTILPENFHLGELPSLRELGFEDYSGSQFTGGESEALNRLESVKINFQLKKQSLSNEETVLSPWITQGCLSPKLVFHKFSDGIDYKNKNKDEHPIYNALLLRDFHRLMGKKHGCLFFNESGVSSKYTQERKFDLKIFSNWKEGETENELVNAIMHQLSNTGYISELCRRITAQYLIYDLNQPWLAGAYHFQEKLIDYDPCSNYGNWLEIAELGPDQRELKRLNFDQIIQKYDPDYSYIDFWKSQGCEIT
jgi:deoxyribodipyrimidine photo-lyase